MTSAEFEYHVQFPTPKDPTRSSNGALTGVGVNNNGLGPSGSDSAEDLAPIWPVDGDDAHIPSSEEKDLVVILLGWAGSKDQYLRKYSDIYLKRG